MNVRMYRRNGGMGRRLALLAGGAALMLAGAAHAQAPAKSAQVEGVTVVGVATSPLGLQTNGAGSRLDIPVIEVPGSVQVISSALIKDRALLSVLGAATQAPGVSYAATPGNGGTALSYRGFQGVGSIVELYDGLQLQVASGTVTFPLDVWNVDKIEILGGPATVLYGQGGIGGTMNVTPKRPDFTAMHHEVQLAGGSFNTFQEALDSTGPLGHNLAYRVDISHVSSDNYVSRGHSDSLAVSGSIALQATPTLKFTLSDDYGQNDPFNYWGTPLINGKFDSSIRRNNYEVYDTVMHFWDNWTKLKTEWTPNEHLSLTNDIYGIEAYRHWIQLTNYVYQPATGLVNESSYREVFHHEYQYGDQANLSYTGALAGLQNKAALGLEVQHIDYQPDNNTPFSGSVNVNPFNPNPGLFNYGVGTHPIFKTRTNTWAFYAEDQLHLTPELSVVGSVRYDGIDVNYTDLTIGTKLYDNGFSYKRSYRTPSYRAGLVYQPIKTLSFYGQYATGNGSISNVVSTSFSQAAFGLARGEQLEAGAKQSFLGGRGEWTLAAYQIIYKNLLTPNPANPTLSLQIGQQSSRGFEGSISVDVGHGLTLSANGTVLRAKFDDFGENVGGVKVSRNGNVPVFVPQQTANAFATWAFAPKWSARASYQYVGKRYSDNANTFVLPAYDLLGFGVRWQAMNDLSLDMKVDNALNRTYAIQGVTGFSQYILGPPIKAQFTLNKSF